MSDEKALKQVKFEFPVSVDSAAMQLDQIDAEIKRLNSIKDKVRKFLKSNIPVRVDEENPNQRVGEIEHVRRLSYKQERTSNEKVLSAVVEELVPKTKLDRVEELKQEHTKEIWVDRFSIIEEDDDYGF